MSILSVDTIQPIGSGSTVTLNAAKIVVGTGITFESNGQAIYAGIITATSFSGSGANLTGVLSNIVEDTSPQLGGNLDVNTKNILFGDSSDGSSDDVLIFGAGSDLKIHHDGSDSNVVNSTGHLILQSDSILLKNGASSESYIRMSNNGSVELYYDNSKKLETTSAGVTVTGSATASTFSATNNVSAGGNIVINSDTGRLRLGASNDLELFHNGSNSYIQDNGTGALYIGSNNTGGGAGVIIRGRHGEESIIANSDGSVELYHDNSKKLETTSSGATITGNLAFPSGNGIDFSSTEGSGATTSVLDDYEEGVFTPTLSGATTDNNMHYTKIGRVVHISGSLAFSSISGSGNMIIGGLPYTSINTLDSYTTLSAHAYDSLNVGNQTYQFQTVRVNQNSTNMMIIIPAGNGNVRTFAQYSHVSSSTFRFRVAGFYITA